MHKNNVVETVNSVLVGLKKKMWFYLYFILYLFYLLAYTNSVTLVFQTIWFDRYPWLMDSVHLPGWNNGRITHCYSMTPLFSRLVVAEHVPAILYTSLLHGPPVPSVHLSDLPCLSCLTWSSAPDQHSLWFWIAKYWENWRENYKFQ